MRQMWSCDSRVPATSPWPSCIAASASPSDGCPSSPANGARTREARIWNAAAAICTNAISAPGFFPPHPRKHDAAGKRTCTNVASRSFGRQNLRRVSPTRVLKEVQCFDSTRLERPRECALRANQPTKRATQTLDSLSSFDGKRGSGSAMTRVPQSTAGGNYGHD